jgi:3-hydroxyacyl-CoA dehydrogenase / enoyl-CoA hydratase / 3-hydroxybutyryl-CoA epimerase
MAASYRHFALDRDSRDVVTATLDVRGYPVNVFADEVVQELALVVDELEKAPPRLVVFRSGKSSGFLAGADVRRIRDIATPDEARTALRAGRQLFDRIERLACPTVAVIHGVCLGGGLEFALACTHRFARDDARLGLPEIQLGLIPGWGGTQRLPRLVGLRSALRMILEGGKLSATEAVAIGLVDRSAPAERLDAELVRFIDDRLEGKPLPARRRGFAGSFLDQTRLGRRLVMHSAWTAIGRRSRHYPALPAALTAIAAGLRRPDLGPLAEEDAFVRVLFTDTARSLIDLFFQRERAGKAATWAPAPEGEARKVRQVAVIGAGAMGAGIAQLAAIQGASVVLKEINDELAQAGMKRVRSLMDDAVKKNVIGAQEAEARMRTVTATTDWAPLENADLAIEAVVEREDIKREIFRELGRRLPAESILATNTSSLTVGRVAAPAAGANRVAGLHFFNPVHRMQLVEVVRGPDTSDRTIAALVDFVRRLGKTPVVVADGPGFLVNRILFPYLDEAVRLLGEGYTTATIDRAAVRFGMPMGPLELLDQVGLDVAADVAASLAAVRGDPSPTPKRLASMVKRGWLGRKAGHGFYVYKHGRRGRPSRSEEPAPPHKVASASEDTSANGLTGVQRRLIYPMINEAARCLETGVADAAWVIDLAMVLGTGFAPFRGGPLHAADSWGIAQVVSDLENLRRGAGPRFDPCQLLRDMKAEGRGFYPAAATPRAAPAAVAKG